MEFFNDLGKKFSQAAKSVQERTRDGVESTKLAMDIRSLKSELDQHLLELGRAYYESITGGNPVPENLIRNVRDSQAQIESLTAQRDRARQQSRCPSCGSVQPDEARFCANCGHPMPEKAPAAEEPAAEAEYCAQCGAMREDDCRFCPVCGHSFLPEENPPKLTGSAVSLPPLEEPEDTRAE